MSESFVRREPCPSCGFPIGLRGEDLTGSASCPVCAAVIVLEQERVGHGPGREGMFLAVRTPPTAAKGTQMLVDVRDGRLEVTLAKPAPTYAQAALIGVACSALLVVMMWLKGEPIAAIAILASLTVAGLTAMLPLTGPTRETLIIDAHGVSFESVLQGKKTLRALGAAPLPNLRVDIDGTKGVVVLGDGDLNAFGRLVGLTAEQARWIAAEVDRRLRDRRLDGSR